MDTDDEQREVPGTGDNDRTNGDPQTEQDEEETEQDEDEAVAGMYQSESEESPIADELEDAGPDDDEPKTPRFDAPLMDEAGEEPETSSGTFYVKYAQESAVTLHEVNTGQIFTLIENDGLETHDIIEASLIAQPPMQVSYAINELDSHRSVPVETSPEPPTQQVREIGEDMEVGEAVAIDREGDGEIHILSVHPGSTESTAEELHDDEMTYKNAARYEIGRVEIRTDEDVGTVSIRYLP